MPDLNKIAEIEHEIEALNVILAAAEPWSKQYFKDSESHEKLIKLESKLEKVLRDYLRSLAADRADGYVDWVAYNFEIIKKNTVQADAKALKVVDLFISSSFGDDESGFLATVLHDPIKAGIALGALGGEKIYNVPLGLSESSSLIQDVARNKVAELVTRINDSTRDRVRNSIATSLELGEDHTDAVHRLKGVIDDTKRAGTIARTETVNAYGVGLNEFGNASGAVGKEWQAVSGACPLCEPNQDEGMIPMGELFSSGDETPAAHPNCRCGLRLVYQAELDAKAAEGED